MNSFMYGRKRSFVGHLLSFFLILTVPCPLAAGAGARIEKGERLYLSKCVEIGTRRHPQIIAATHNLEVIKSRIGQSQAGYYPQISWSAGLSRNASPLRPDPFNQYSHSLSLNQNIYDFNRTGTSVDIQSLNLDAARADLENVTLQVILGIKQAYFEVLRSQRTRDISAETVKQFEQHLETAKGLFEAGAKPIFDVTKAEVDLSNARVNMLKAENAVVIALVSLNNAMGMPEAPPYDLEDDVAHEKNVLELSEALKKAYLMRQDLRSLLIRKEAAQKSLERAGKDYLPTLSGSASYGWSGEDYPLERGWNIGASLNLNLFSGFLTRNQIQEAAANLSVTQANEEALRQSIRLEIETASANLQEAEKRIAAAEIIVRQAEENLGLARGRYAAGVGSPLEVTDALVAQSNARITMAGAVYDYKIAEASLRKAMGEQ